LDGKPRIGDARNLCHGAIDLGLKRKKMAIITQILVRFEVFTAVTMKNGVFWHVTPCGSCKHRRFAGT
jgi:hypothetical protein